MGLIHQNRQATIATLLKEHAGYDVVWKGKWHLSYASNAAPGNGGEDWGPADIKVMEANWGWSGWNPPDAGTAIQQAQGTPFGVFNGNNTAGGGNPNNDGRYVSGTLNATPGQIPGVGGESFVEFLRGRKGSSNPFCMFVSLVNPHDIGAYPGNLITPPAWQQVGYKREDFAHLGIKLPPNYADDLSTKPSIQKLARDNYDKFAPLGGPEGEEEYINFYAYLHKVVDKHITTVLDTLEETGLMENTIILRFADHGEGGLSHGFREKAYTAYEEMIHVPLIVTEISCRRSSISPAFAMRSPTASARASFQSCKIRPRRSRTTRCSHTMTCSSFRPRLQTVTSGRCARATGCTRPISAWMAAAANPRIPPQGGMPAPWRSRCPRRMWNMSFTISRAILVR